MNEEIVVKKKLSHSIERIDLKEFRCFYQYKFSTSQWLESIDNYEYFGIKHDDLKQKVIDSLVQEFKIALNSVVFGDPVGKEYVQYLKMNQKSKIYTTEKDISFLKTPPESSVSLIGISDKGQLNEPICLIPKIKPIKWYEFWRFKDRKKYIDEVNRCKNEFENIFGKRI